MADSTLPRRAGLVRRGLTLNYITLAYNTVEAVVSISAGLMAGSVALVGFGVDSGIEVTGSLAAQWRLRADVDLGRRERAEHVTRRVIGFSFLALAVYVLADSLVTVWKREAPEFSTPGLVILILSVLVMPVLAQAKRRVALALHSRALEADAAQTSLCAYLSVIALGGVALNGALGWWWADPLAALAMVPLIAKEGIEGARGDACCQEECGLSQVEPVAPLANNHRPPPTRSPH
jgi:divalent metal cation (Fe/Co/Zn/Cd) transporter